MADNNLKSAQLEMAKRELAKRQQALTPESQGAIKQANGLYRAPTFGEGLKQAAIGAGNYFGKEAIGLGQFALKGFTPSIKLGKTGATQPTNFATHRECRKLGS